MIAPNKHSQKIINIDDISKVIASYKKLTLNNEIFENIERLRLNVSKSKIFDYHANKKSAAELIKKDSTPPKWCRFLFEIIKSFGFCSCLELGTCLGFSSAYMAAALSQNGRLISIEGLEDRANMARHNLKSLGLNNFRIYTGQFSQVLPSILKINKFDFVYMDGHHKEAATLKYFDLIYPSLNRESIVIIDDIHWPGEMIPVWNKIQKDIRIDQTQTINKWGVCYIKKPK